MVKFDTLVVITPKDCARLIKLYPRLVDYIPNGRIIFVGTKDVQKVLEDAALLGERTAFIDENDIISFEDVHKCIEKKMRNILAGRELPRGITGWYYQQFLKMQYAKICRDDYYLVWDGDTIPCRMVQMFSEETGNPYFDIKHEYHKYYFDTISTLLNGMDKVIEQSFISEHMIMSSMIMKEMIHDIEVNKDIEGEHFWEKIINSIPEERIQESAFSEFETYGTYTAIKHTSTYRLREWHSFRQGGEFFSIDTINDRDFKWLSIDFDAISFEKGHSVREDNANLFDNPYYQEKLTPKQMLQAAQQEYKEGYKEYWSDDDPEEMVNDITDNGNGKIKLLFFDLYKKGPDSIDAFFDEGVVELSEIFTADGDGGVDILELPFYEGWDYLVIPCTIENYSKVKTFVEDIRIPENKVIYIVDNKVTAVNYEKISCILQRGVR